MTPRLLVFAGLWLASLAAVLQLHQVQTSWTHVLCGPWGCGPPTEAVVAMQGFWLIGMGGLAWLCAGSWPSGLLRCVGIVLGVAGLLALVGIGLWDFRTYLPQTQTAPNRYLWQRFLWTVATAVDVPAVQSVLVGTCLTWAARRRRKATATLAAGPAAAPIPPGSSLATGDR